MKTCILVTEINSTSNIRRRFCLNLHPRKSFLWKNMKKRSFKQMHSSEVIPLNKICCVNTFSVAFMKHHHQGNLQKSEFLGAYSSWDIRVHCGGKSRQKQVWLQQKTENSHLWSRRRKREGVQVLETHMLVKFNYWFKTFAG